MGSRDASTILVHYHSPLLAQLKTLVVQQLLARGFFSALTLTRPSAVPVHQESQSSVGSWLSSSSEALPAVPHEYSSIRCPRAYIPMRARASSMTSGVTAA